MRRLFYADSDADRWLRSYTHDTFSPKVVPPNHILDELQEEYGLESNTTVYRGINFRTQEKFEKFMNEISSGTVTFNRITSWSKSSTEAERFAKITMIDQPNLEVMELYDRQQKDREHIAGYAGVIIETVATPETALCDVTKSQYSRESEVILLPGTYNVRVYKEIRTYKDQLKDVDINEHLQNNDIDDEKMDYILHHHNHILNDKNRKLLFERYKPKKLFSVKVTNRGRYLGEENEEVAAIIIVNYDFLNRIYPSLNEGDQESIIDQLNEEFREEIKQVKENKDKITRFEGASYSFLSKFIGPKLLSELFDIIQDLIRKNYEEANQRARDAYKNSSGGRVNAERFFKDFMENSKMLM